MVVILGCSISRRRVPAWRQCERRKTTMSNTRRKSTAVYGGKNEDLGARGSGAKSKGIREARTALGPFSDVGTR